MLSGCSPGRIGRNINVETFIESPGEIFTETVKKQNLTESGFFIQKAEIEVVGSEGTNKFIASIKFKYPDSYLISIRNRTGIEAARIFINSDTILVNDRINRKQFCASTNYLKKKYGLSTAVLPVILGDFIGDMSANIGSGKCKNGEVDIDCLVDGIKMRYLIDCNKYKTVKTIKEGDVGDTGLEINYRDFSKYGRRFIPGRIEVNDLMNESRIIVFIKKLSLPWDGALEFIPGNKYEIIQLI